MGQYALGIFATGRKKLFLGAILILAALGGAAFLLFKANFFARETIIQNKTVNEQARIIANLAVKEALKDTDSDGLKDWEEAIYKTDPENPDTDGDGTSDSDEVHQNRDPLKKGPDDKIVEPTSDTANANTPEIDPKNFTQNFTKALLESGALSSIDENGNLAPGDFLNNLNIPDSIHVESLFANVPSVSRKDLTIVDANDPAFIRDYFTKAGQIYQTTLGSFPESDILIFTTALEQNNFSRIGELDKQADAVGRVAEEIKKLPVPGKYADAAVGEINNLRKIQRIIEVMRAVETDPLAAYFAFQKRLALIDEMTNSTTLIRDELVKDGIFTP
jgi:hypothetical protein